MKIMAAVILAISSCFVTFSTASGSGHRTLPAPASMTQTVKGKSVHAGEWIRFNHVKLAVTTVGNGGWLHAEVEVARGQSFTGSTGYRSHSVFTSKGAPVILHASIGKLAAGSYSWQARIVDAQGTASPWAQFSPGVNSFGIDTTAPSRPKITSATNPHKEWWYRKPNASFTWRAHDSGSGIAGYSYRLGHGTHSPRPHMSNTTGGTYKNIPDGKWVLHVWAKDNAGNWSQVSDYRFNILRNAPKIEFTGLATNHFNPFTQKETWTFTVDRGGKAQVEIMRSKRKKPVASQELGYLKPGTHTFVWNGRNGHNWVVKKGWYWLRVNTTDKLGNTGSFASPGLWIVPSKPKLPFVPEPGHHIVISLSKEALYAYDGSKLVWQSLVTTGNPALPTPTGHFSIFAKFSPFEFISPWPPGSPYWYAPSWTNYAMEFISGGYFIHDAPWRSVFGPGSNGPGTPGTNYGGTHGCVNVPEDTAKFLYGWTSDGTIVDVIN